MRHSTKRERPKKPRPDFPLFPHATGRWAKKIRGKFHYFGKTADDPQGEAALILWLDQKDDLLAGRTPRVASDGFTVRDLCNFFMTAKERQRDAGDITRRTYSEYYNTCQSILAAFGKNRLVDDLVADDFGALRADFARRLGVHRLGNEVQRVRTLFKFGFDDGLFDHPVRLGTTFTKPAKRLVRLHQQRIGDRSFAAAEVRKIIAAAGVPLKAMILLGINSGFGNDDCAKLPLSALDLVRGWIEYPRPKTATDRRCPLWRETVDSIKAAIDARPDPELPEYKKLVFLTTFGQPWSMGTKASPISAEFRKLLVRLKLHREGVGFYSLRRTFATVAGDSCDQVATDFIMGHLDQTMAGTYRQKVFDKRLVAVTAHVRKWLFPRAKAK